MKKTEMTFDYTPPGMCDDCALEAFCESLRDSGRFPMKCPWEGKLIKCELKIVEVPR